MSGQSSAEVRAAFEDPSVDGDGHRVGYHPVIGHVEVTTMTASVLGRR